eukprot:CAMPEP_0113846564 /NCGR_PEP_ID=MMETSP0372-20130328/1379_1 /TAXON_ID=340204 /ORGANISM="Lankesteria abbotti" /LENGTH=341 /DNA_ID=CAMNT_0000815725 /DNA_START=200 /DNA_END=1225 /DNA_ORIENTATION=- /assembly_acc=CAM_ASM_000359
MNRADTTPTKQGTYGVPKWARNIAKSVGDGAQVVSDKWQGKVPPMEQDPLVNQRREINEYNMICGSLQKTLSNTCSLLDSTAMQHPQAEECHKTVMLCEFAGSPELQNTSQKNSEAWAIVHRYYDSAKGRVLQLQFEVKNRMSLIHEAQKSFEQRDKKHQKMIDDNRRVEKQRDNMKPDPHLLEKLTEKAEKSTDEFHSLSQALADQVNHILAGRQRFLQDTTRIMVEAQAEFFAKVSLALSGSSSAVTAMARPSSPPQPPSAPSPNAAATSNAATQLQMYGGAARAAFSGDNTRSSDEMFEQQLQPQQRQSSTSSSFSSDKDRPKSPHDAPPRGSLVNII